MSLKKAVSISIAGPFLCFVFVAGFQNCGNVELSKKSENSVRPKSINDKIAIAGWFVNKDNSAAAIRQLPTVSIPITSVFTPDDKCKGATSTYPNGGPLYGNNAITSTVDANGCHTLNIPVMETATSACGNPVGSPAGTTCAFGCRDHGLLDEFCVEPTGAVARIVRGGGESQIANYNSSLVESTLYGDANGPFKNFTSASQAQPIGLLDELFTGATDLSSTNDPYKQATFYYGLAVVVVPETYSLTANSKALEFGVRDLDDAMLFIVNGKLCARMTLQPPPAAGDPADQVRFKRDLSSCLVHGNNSLIVIWMDDAAARRVIDQAQFLSYGEKVGSTIPNLVRGYMRYPDGSPRYPMIVKIVDSNNNLVKTTSTDSSGFYQIGGLPDGTFQVRAPGSSGADVTVGTVDLYFKDKNKTIVTVNKDY